MAEYDNKVALGSSITQLVTLIKNALTGKQNTLTAGSGIDITNDVISSTGGGSSLPTDPSTDGAYKLVNTVETESGEQSATLSWEEDSGYTAGEGIFIENNVIYNQAAYSDILMALLRANISGNSYGNLDTIDKLINNLLGGGAYLINSSASNRTASTTLMNKLGCYSIITFNSNGTYDKANRYSSYTFERQYIYFKQGASLVRIANNDQYAFLNNIAYQNTTSGLTATTVKGAIDELATTRIADTLVSTETTPSTNNTINWLYE